MHNTEIWRQAVLTLQVVDAALAVGVLDEDVVVVRLVALEPRAARRLGAHEAVVAHEHQHRPVHQRHVEAVLRLQAVVDGAQAAVEMRADVLVIGGSHCNLAVTQVFQVKQALC